jgi:hypothetical protein
MLTVRSGLLLQPRLPASRLESAQAQVQCCGVEEKTAQDARANTQSRLRVELKVLAQAQMHAKVRTVV